ncbi:hypothetical protein BASA62_007793 [Batrachochytrium salamandrivorans]|nr:hypothetical protein BASA62_007793 [Batrachochytrium salamandrivorans]
MAAHYNFKKVQVVPSAAEFVDIVLSKINRKTPTVVHPNYQISRIRQFYMRKVKFGQDCFDEKLISILTDFPKLDEIHPFYADLMNVLYNRDHYKLALAQINTARHLIDSVAKDYARLLKFGDSLFRCKQLKKAALGRMATIMKRQKDSLQYLEQVRQHLSRLPSIDPNTLIDTPGILDHPLEQRNTIEMQSITALAHLRACIMFFIDLSENCGYSVAEQIQLYHSIKPLFANKPTMIVVNKIDIRKPEDLNPEEKALLDEVLSVDDVSLVQLSCYTEEGVMDVRNASCDKLLASRVDSKLRGAKLSTVINKLHLAQPVRRDDVARTPFIPEGVLSKVKYDITDPNRRKLQKDIEIENGGAGVFNVDIKAPYILANNDWKYDTIPEIMDGKNVADFIDPEIAAKLDALEKEEERLIADGFYKSDDDTEDEEDLAILDAAKKLHTKKQIIIAQNRERKNRNRSVLPKKDAARLSRFEDFEKHLAKIGSKGDIEGMRARSQIRKRPRSESAMSVDGASRSQSRVPTRDRSVMGLRNIKQKVEADLLKKKIQKIPNLYAKRGEADREILVKKPKHLLSGKRGMGKTERR